MLFDLTEKVCLVTGASRGIGLALVQALLKHGTYCLMVDVDYKEGEKQAKLLQDEFGPTKINFKRVDVSSNSNFESAFEKCLELYGGIDVVVNNAGVEGEINWETQLQINFLGTIRGCKLALKYMGKNNYGNGLSTNRGGVILNISSIQGLQFWPAMPTYCSGKAGIITYTRSAGHELEFAQHGVKFICLCPGAVQTSIQDYHPYAGMTEVGTTYLEGLEDQLGKFLTPEEVGEAGAQLMKTASTASVWHLHQNGEAPYEIPNQYQTIADVLKHQK